MPSAHTLLRSAPRAALAAALVASLLVVATPGAGAQDEPTPAEQAQVSGVATPFVGTYEMWCTERNPGASCRNHHTSPGIDVGMAIGTPLFAAGAGTVVEVEANCRAYGCRGGAGLFIEIGHADGTSSRYLHLDALFVEVGDVVEVGQLIATSGATGQRSSPHLHYDEKDAHYPFGSRMPFGPWLSCVGGEVRQYPDHLGYTNWNDVPYGSIIVNEGFECLGGVAATSPPPALLTGPGRIAVAVPGGTPGSAFEVEVTTTVDDTPSTQTLPLEPGSMLPLAAPDGSTIELRMRTMLGDAWTEWSPAIAHDPATVLEAPTCRGYHATTEGTIGTAGVDVILGTDGPDVIDAGAGDDFVCGGAGDDTIDAGDGNDRVDGGTGHDIILGGPGRDRLSGQLGRDQIDAGDGRDRISGGAGHDQLVGGAHGDVIVGGSGHDFIRGVNGSDRIAGSGGGDTILGGGGNDRLFGNAGSDAIDGGAGTDRCQLGTTVDNALDTETMERCEL